MTESFHPTKSPDTGVPAALFACPAGSGWLLAYSGGLDSSVLLHAASVVARQRGIGLRALHINHQLSEHAARWQAHCEQQCAQWGVECLSVAVDVVNEGEGLEAAARTARYAVFSEQLRDQEQLLLGHHLDDQAETLLLRLMRGAGPVGLGAMQPARALAAGRLNRPLLSLARANLEAYAAQHALSWVEDESNASLNFDRNFLRHQIMPQLQQRWPGFTQRWQQSAELCAQSALLDEQLAASDLMACEVQTERWGWSLSLEPLRRLTSYRRGNLLRYWLTQQRLATPEQKHLEQVEVQLLHPRSDAKSQIVWGQGAERLSLRVYKQRLYLLPELEQAIPDHIVGWSVAQPLVWGVWELRAEPVAKASAGLLLPATVEVRARRGGERCRPVGRRHSQSLKKLLQEAALEPWLREQLPLIYSDNVLLAVGDLWGCEGSADKTAQSYRLSWQWAG